MFRQLMALAAVVLAIVALGGCGGGSSGLYEAKGKVTYKGAPVAGASVTFQHSEGQVSSGTTDAQGEFKLVTFGRPGAPLGQYTVGVRKSEASEGAVAAPKPEDMIKMMKGKSIPRPKEELPAKFSAPQTSGLSAAVTTDATKNVFTFDLKD